MEAFKIMDFKLSEPDPDYAGQYYIVNPDRFAGQEPDCRDRYRISGAVQP